MRPVVDDRTLPLPHIPPGSRVRYLSDIQVAAALGFHPVTLRKWRAKNKQVGEIKHGPPYEYRGVSVVYPEDKFQAWLDARQTIDGVTHYRAPVPAGSKVPS